MKRNVFFVGILPLLALLVLSANKIPAVSPPAPTSARQTPVPAETSGPPARCEACVQAALAVAATQEKIQLRVRQPQITAQAQPLLNGTVRQSAEGLISAETNPIHATPSAMATDTPPTASPPPYPTAWPVSLPTFAPLRRYPFISGVSDHSHQIFLLGQSLGNRANVFSKIGDSITANEAFLVPIGWGRYDLHQYTYLAPVIAYFSQANARTANSFANTSLAAHGGWTAWQVINPGAAFEPRICNSKETPLECEYRVVKPSVALIMIGTNDVGFTSAAQYEAELRQIIQTSISQGIIPVVSTIPPLHHDWAVGRVELINGIIVSLAREYDIPLWDYWSALQGLPNDSLGTDGIHPSVDTGHAADFSQDYIQTGYAVRNLVALQALDAVWRAALH